MGVALGPCVVPAAGTPSFVLADDEIELGLGIHGEAGVRRETIAPARQLVAELLSTIVASSGLAAGARVVLLVNDLGATTPMELDVVTAAALAYALEAGLVVERVLCGRFLTSLDMPGVSLSLVRVDDELLRHLDAPTDAPAWPSSAAHGGIDLNKARLPVAHSQANADLALHADGRGSAVMLRSCLEAIIATLLQNEARLTELDQAVGDGDLGISLSRAASAIRASLAQLNLNDPAATLETLASIIRRVVGGTSGPLYAMFLLRAARSLDEAPQVDAFAWSAAFRAGCEGIAELGGAKRGDRTLLDALSPAAHAFTAGLHANLPTAPAWKLAARAAREGATATQKMLARRGRSQYLGDRVLSHPDPGAVAASLWLEALLPILTL